MSHSAARNEIKVRTIGDSGLEEGHLLLHLVVGSDPEGNDLCAVEHLLHVDEEFLAMPDIVGIFAGVGVLATGRVTACNEVGDAAVHTGRGMPQNLGGSTIEHRRGPDSEDGVFGVEGSVIEEGLVLEHAGVERDIIILAPATKRVEEEDGVLVALLEELFTGIIEEEDVAIMERVAHLEGVDGIGILISEGLRDLNRG